MEKDERSTNFCSIVKDDFLQYYRENHTLKSKIGSTIYVLLEPGFWAVFNHRIAHWLFLKNLGILALFIMRLNKFFHNVDISYEAKIGKALRLPHCMDIVIGSSAIIGDNVEILNGVTLGAVKIRTEGKRHPTIGGGVLIGAGAKVLGDIYIGNNSIIGANAVVIDSFPENVKVGGIPAKEIGKVL